MSNLLIDTYTTYRIITTLTKPWNKQEAYEFGIIDENGKVLRKAKDLKTSKEKASYSILIRFIFNLKRLMEKLPGGKSKIGSYAVAAVIFLKEEADNDEELKKLIGEEYEKEK